MDLTGSIAEATTFASADIFNAVRGGLTGSSAVDTLVRTVVGLPGLVLSLGAGLGADIGSTLGALGFPPPLFP